MKSYTEIDPPGSVPNTPGGIASDADGINDKGEVAGTYFDTKVVHGGAQGFEYFHGTYTLLPFSPAWINDKGDMVGTTSDGHGYLYSGGQLTVLDVPGASATNMVSINDKGQIAGVYVNNGGAHGFLYDHGTFYSIDPPGSAGGAGPTIKSMNDKGEVVGRFQTTQGGSNHAFLYDNGAYTNIDFPGASGTDVVSINDKEQRTFGTYGDSTGFLYDHGTYTTVDLPAGTGFPSAINDKGEIVGYDANGIGFLRSLEPTLIQAMAFFGDGSGVTSGN